MAASRICKILSKDRHHVSIGQAFRRYYSQDIKKFYDKAHITQVDGKNGFYEVNLDTKKIKTPNGALFQVPGLPLAQAVVNEWNSQKDTIKKFTMHFTSLCNTAIDNPTDLSKADRATAIGHFLGTDTLCFRMEEPEDLYKFQCEQWDPILQWVADRFGVVLMPTTSIVGVAIPDQTKEVVHQHLMSYSDWSLVGVQNLVESLKSVTIALALMDRHIGVKEAVNLSRVEQIYQCMKWGNVEWHHDVDALNTMANVGASVLFTHFCEEFSVTTTKSVKNSVI